MTSSPNTLRVRRLGVLVAVSLLGLPLLGTGAQAAPTEECNPTPEVASSFCVTFDSNIGPTLNARDPFDFGVSFSNTSDSHETEQARWIGSITLRLAASGTTPPSVRPSKSLPDDLVIAGADGDCATPTFAACDAGHGVFVVNISNASVPLLNGDRSGTFGVERIVSLNDAGTDPGTIRFRIDLHVCVPFLGSCDFDETYSEVVEAPVPPAEGPGAVHLTIPVLQQGSFDESGVTGDFRGTLDSGEIHLKGTATKVVGQADPVGPFQVFKLPARCGAVTASAEFASHQVTPRTVEIGATPVVFGGCPTAAFTSTMHGSKATFNGGGSAAHVPGRTVKTWRWAFGDGTHLTRFNTASAAHLYPLSPTTATNYTVRLVVLDSKGAISLPATAIIQGTATKIAAPVKSPMQLKVPGTVAPFLAGQHVKVTLQRKQGDAFHTIGTKLPELNGASQYTAIFSPRPPAGMCRAIARYPGDATHLASSQTKSFSC